jgi:hypothetical protein
MIVIVPGLTAGMVPQVPRLRALGESGFSSSLSPSVPGLPATIQASLFTGAGPGRHRVVSSGVFVRETGSVLFGEPSARLLDVPPLWREWRAAGKRVALLFTEHAAHADVDLSLSVRWLPGAGADGLSVGGLLSRPAGLSREITERLGRDFPFANYRGPLASADSARWIAEAAAAVWDAHRPDVLAFALPNLLFALERWGPGSPPASAELAALDEMLGPPLERVLNAAGDVLVIGGCAVNPVGRTLFPNRMLREAGLLDVFEVRAREHPDIGGSAAFAVADHQIAHVYCHEQAHIPATENVFAGVPGIARVLSGEARAAAGFGHPRCGDAVLLAEPDAWFAYYWWLESGKAPPLARTADARLKPGADPMELFVNPRIKAVDFDVDRVRGSYGTFPADPADPSSRPAVIAAGGRSPRQDDGARATELTAESLLREMRLSGVRG